jgi:hypothetical protein
MDTVAIAVGVGFTANKTLMKAVEFTGVENQVAALASDNRGLLSKALIGRLSLNRSFPKPCDGLFL